MKKFLPVILLFFVSCVPWNVAPDGKFLTPENGSEYQRGEPIEVYIKASDDRGIDEVRLYLNGIGISSMSEFPYSYTLETIDLEIGNHSLKAEIIDNMGKEAQTDVGFTITTGLPVVETLQPILISENAAMAAGVIIDDGGGTISKTGILWSNVPYNASGAQVRNTELKDSIFSVILSNLDYTNYYVTAFAENENGRAYGEEIGFNVPEPEPDPLP
jgi:hypothetical protein